VKKIILAGGCFWGVEAYYKRLKGILSTTVGYTDAEGINPSYEDVCHQSGHAEAVKVEYDEKLISLEKILEHFFRIVNPTTINKQGNDVGIQYRSGIFLFEVSDLEKVQNYLDSIKKKYLLPIQTVSKLASNFYDAENYHQDYLDKVPGGYCHINLHLAKNNELKEEYRD